MGSSKFGFKIKLGTAHIYFSIKETKKIHKKI